MTTDNIPTRCGWLCNNKTLFLLLALITLIPAAGGAGQREEWRDQMLPIVPRGYLCPFATSPIRIDGKFDEAAWATAPWTDDFVDIQSPAKPAPPLHTRAKLLWDEDYLYIAAEMQEPHLGHSH